MRICVFCASSDKVAPVYFEAAREWGRIMAGAGIELVYGGGSRGLMGALADAVLAGGGSVEGIIPRFMHEVEWSHTGLTRLVLVDDMRERKRLMSSGVDAVVALAGGCGTLEELAEVITLKRLGQFTKPIIILNTNGLYDHLALLLEQMVGERFMRSEHAQMWTFVRTPAEVLPAIAAAKAWSAEAIGFAAV